MRRQLPPEGGAHAGSRPEQRRHRVDADLGRALGGNQRDQAVDATLGLRVAGQQESQGLDLALHDEAGYRL